MLEQLLVKGGDERILTIQNGANQYYIPPGYKDGHINRSSCTCNMISKDSFDFLISEYEYFSRINNNETYYHTLANDVKIRLRKCLGLKKSDTYIHLTPSGTDSELLFTFLSCMKFKLSFGEVKILNIIPSDTEVGRGMKMASSLSYFGDITPSGDSVKKGKRLSGTEEFQLNNFMIPFRDNTGKISDMKKIENSILNKIDIFFASEAGAVILRLVYCSKTGLQIPTLSFAKKLKKQYPKNRVIITVNNIQMRSSINEIKWCMENDIVLSLSGSKFFGGPPFSGALIFPRSEYRIFEDANLELPSGFKKFFSPDCLDHGLLSNSKFLNFSLLFRWKAALLEMEKYYALDEKRVNAIVCEWHAKMTALKSEHIEFVPVVPIKNIIGLDKSILCFTLHQKDGVLFDMSQLKNIHKFMSMDLTSYIYTKDLNTKKIASTPISLGQPVSLCENKTILRIALSAPQIVNIDKYGIETELSKDRIVLKKLEMISKYYKQIANEVMAKAIF